MTGFIHLPCISTLGSFEHWGLILKEIILMLYHDLTPTAL